MLDYFKYATVDWNTNLYRECQVFKHVSTKLYDMCIVIYEGELRALNILLHLKLPKTF